MKTSCTILLSMFFAISLFAQSGGWFVQIAAFETQVSQNYFKDVDQKVIHARNGFGFHRYYVTDFANESEAKAALNKLDEKGYNTVLVSRDVFFSPCCSPNRESQEEIIQSLKNIFFDFDKSNITAKARVELDKLVGVLNSNSSYTTTFRAHTDAKGSNAYNEALSMRRADSAKRYLIAKGISSSRIKTDTFGEGSPIAKNELNNGQDTETGRQFNRRVEIIIHDGSGHVLNNMVDEIDVPSELKN